MCPSNASINMTIAELRNKLSTILDRKEKLKTIFSEVVTTLQGTDLFPGHGLTINPTLNALGDYEFDVLGHGGSISLSFESIEEEVIAKSKVYIEDKFVWDMDISLPGNVMLHDKDGKLLATVGLSSPEDKIIFKDIFTRDCLRVLVKLEKPKSK